MLEKIKHNKIKNTGVIYQVLVKKMIDQTINHQKPIAHQIFNKFFNKQKEMGKQLEIYNILTETRYENQQKANILFEESLQQRKKINQSQLQKQKYLCIKQLKSNYDLKSLFNTKIQNYKIYAGIYKVFESLKKQQYNPLNIVQAKYRIIQFMLKPMRQQVVDQDLQLFKKQSKAVKEKALQVFIQKFNQKYSVLNTKQKQILKKYAYSVSDTTQLNEYIDTQLDSLKQLVSTKSLNDQLKNKVSVIIENIDKVKSLKNIEDKVYTLMSLYQIQKTLVK